MRRWLLVCVLFLGALLVAADFIARSVAQRELANRLHARVPSASGVSAEIHSFPFLPRLLASGHVSQVDASVRDVEVEGLRFASIDAELHGVRLERASLRDQRRVVIESIDRGTVRAVVTEDALAAAFGVDVSLEEGRATVTVAGRRVTADVEVRNGRLVAFGVDLGVSLPALSLVAPLLPCVPNAAIEPGRVALTCEFDEIPEELKAIA